MPTSITVAPGRTKSGVTIAARPIAATTMSARRTTSGKSRVFEWQIVTVAFACISSSAMRLAHNVAAADHHGVCAFEWNIAAAQNFHHARRRAGHQRRRVRDQMARRSWDEIRPHPSPGSTASRIFFESTCFGSGICTRMPSTSSRRFKSSTMREQLLGRNRRGRREVKAAEAQFFAGGDLAVHVEFRRGIVAHQHRREPGRIPAGSQRGDFRRQLAINLISNCVAVEDACGQCTLLVACAE